MHILQDSKGKPVSQNSGTAKRLLSMLLCCTIQQNNQYLLSLALEAVNDLHSAYNDKTEGKLRNESTGWLVFCISFQKNMSAFMIL